MTLSLTTAGRYYNDFAAALGTGWTTGAGSWSCTSGVLREVGLGYITRDLGTADQYVSLRVPPMQNPNVLARWTDQNNRYVAQFASNTVINLYRVLSGSATKIGTVDSKNISGATVRIECIGTSVKVFYNADSTPCISVTETGLTTGNKCGAQMETNGDTNDWDNADFRTRANVLVTSLPTGYYARLTDGTNVVDAAASSGTATITPSTAQGFGPWTLRIYNGNPASGGTQQGADQTGVYGGDSWAGVFVTSVYGEASLSTHGDITASALRFLSGSVSLAAHGDTSASAYRNLRGASSLTGRLAITADALRTLYGGASLVGMSDLTAACDLINTLWGAASLATHGDVEAAAYALYSGASNLAGHGDLDATAFGLLSAAAELEAHGDLTATASGILSGSSDLSASAFLNAAAILVSSGSATLTARSELSAEGRVIIICLDWFNEGIEESVWVISDVASTTWTKTTGPPEAQWTK